MATRGMERMGTQGLVGSAGQGPRAVGPAREGQREGSRSDLGVTLLASVSIAIPLVFYLHQHVEMLRYGYEIEALKQRRAELVERRRDLSAERAGAASYVVVEERARDLGLVAPGPDDVYDGMDRLGSPATFGGASEAGAARSARLD